MHCFDYASNSYKKYPFQVCVHESGAKGVTHGQDYYELFITYSDNCVYHLNAESYPLPHGAVVLVGPDVLHRIDPADDQAFRFINLSFPKEVLWDLERFLHAEGEISALYASAQDRMVFLDETQTEKWTARIKGLLGIAMVDARTAELEMRTLLAQLFTKLYLQQDAKQTALPVWLEELCRFLRQDTNFALSLEEIAAHAGRSKEHLCRSMRRYLGMSPMAYVNHLRLLYAASMLENSDMPIMEICLSAGFFSGSYFNRLFRAEYGLSPREYRQANQY